MRVYTLHPRWGKPNPMPSPIGTSESIGSIGADDSRVASKTNPRFVWMVQKGFGGSFATRIAQQSVGITRQALISTEHFSNHE